MNRTLTLALALTFCSLAAAKAMPPQEVERNASVALVAEVFVPDSIYLMEEIDQVPEFPGGLDSLYSFLAKNIKWPCKCGDCDCFGKVYVTFVIEKDGTLSHGQILRDLCPSCCPFGEEALRVVGLMPKWKPGLKDGKPVRVRFNLPINFILH